MLKTSWRQLTLLRQQQRLSPIKRRCQIHILRYDPSIDQVHHALLQVLLTDRWGSAYQLPLFQHVLFNFLSVIFFLRLLFEHKFAQRTFS